MRFAFVIAFAALAATADEGEDWRRQLEEERKAREKQDKERLKAERDRAKAANAAAAENQH